MMPTISPDARWVYDMMREVVASEQRANEPKGLVLEPNC